MTQPLTEAEARRVEAIDAAPDAEGAIRERLGRYLFERSEEFDSLASPDVADWDEYVERNREEWRQEADAILALLAGPNPATAAEDGDLIADALEGLWHRSPQRRSEIEAEMRRRGLWHDLVPLAGDMVTRAELRRVLAREADEAEAHADATAAVQRVQALEEVAAERQRQDAKWGEQNHPDGTAVFPAAARREADEARRVAAFDAAPDAAAEIVETVAQALWDAGVFDDARHDWTDARILASAAIAALAGPDPATAAVRRVEAWAAMHDDMARRYDEAALSVKTLALVDEAQQYAEDCRAIAEGVRNALRGESR